MLNDTPTGARLTIKGQKEGDGPVPVGLHPFSKIVGIILPLPKNSPLRCILDNWGKFRQDGLRKKINFLLQYCMAPYKLGDQKIWPENGSLNYNTILQLDLFCKRKGRWGGNPVCSNVHDAILRSRSKELLPGVPGSHPFKVPSSPTGA